jgi:hypothetical protein
MNVEWRNDEARKNDKLPMTIAETRHLDFDIRSSSDISSFLRYSREDGRATDATDGCHEGGGSQAYIAFLGKAPNFFESGGQHAIEFLPHAVEIPPVMLPVLGPFEVTHGDTACIGQDIG